MLVVLLDVVPSLLHENFERSLVLLSEVFRWFRHIQIYYLRKQVDVTLSVMQDTVDKIRVSGGAKELLYVIEFYQ